MAGNQIGKCSKSRLQNYLLRWLDTWRFLLDRSICMLRSPSSTCGNLTLRSSWIRGSKLGISARESDGVILHGELRTDNILSNLFLWIHCSTRSWLWTESTCSCEITTLGLLSWRPFYFSFFVHEACLSLNSIDMVHVAQIEIVHLMAGNFYLVLDRAICRKRFARYYTSSNQLLWECWGAEVDAQSQHNHLFSRYGLLESVIKYWTPQSCK